MTNTKSHNGFPLTQRSMTLDDLELLCQILLEFRDISRVSEAITAKRMKIDSYCQRRNCSPLNVLVDGAYITLISQGLPLIRGVKQWSGENKIFELNA